jgi:hypothetical protein
MPRQQLLYCATDKEIFDLLSASKQSITDVILLDIARERGIFYSPSESRDVLINRLSLLPYGHADLETILDHRATTQRTEKRSSITLRGAISMEDIRAVCGEYREAAPADEKVATRQEGTNKFTATVNYSELDYSKTRLLQRREKEADVEFVVKDNETTIRIPANPKAREIVETLREALGRRANRDVEADEIELSALTTPEERTTFFTSLITGMSGYTLSDVKDVKVESRLNSASADLDIPEDDEADADSDTDLAARRAMLAIVENIALKGSLLLNSAEYQQLRQKGFYITNIVWTAKQNEAPYDILEFDAGFEYPREGKGFKYNVRGVYRFLNGSHNKTIRQISKDQRQPYFNLLENTARDVLKNLSEQAAARAEVA